MDTTAETVDKTKVQANISDLLRSMDTTKVLQAAAELGKVFLSQKFFFVYSWLPFQFFYFFFFFFSLCFRCARYFGFFVALII
jgi:hypothetical protein